MPDREEDDFVRGGMEGVLRDVSRTSTEDQQLAAAPIDRSPDEGMGRKDPQAAQDQRHGFGGCSGIRFPQEVRQALQVSQRSGGEPKRGQTVRTSWEWP